MNRSPRHLPPVNHRYRNRLLLAALWLAAATMVAQQFKVVRLEAQVRAQPKAGSVR